MLGLNYKEIVFIIFGVLSAATLIIGVCFCFSRRERIGDKFGVNAWQFFTGFAFAAVLFIHIPVYYIGADLGGGIKILSPAFISLLKSARVFITDGDINMIVGSLVNVRGWIAYPYTFLSALLFVGCPVLTANLLLAFFRGFLYQIKFALTKNKKIYIMSELNEMSLALASSIKEGGANTKDSLIVFAGVKKAEDANQDAQLETVKKLGAIYLKQDVTSINYSANRNFIEVFLISKNETENIEKTIAIWAKEPKGKKVKIFVYATSPFSGHIIDSLDKENIILSDSIKEKIKNDENISGRFIETGIKDIEINYDFDVKRVDYISDFAIKMLDESKVFELCKKSEEKVISILIAGIGKFGKEVLKTALWYCQIDGYKLEINVIDNGIDKRGFEHNVIETLKHECPEIISKNYPNEDAKYDIRFFTVDCFNDSINRLFKEQKQRLLRTQAVFVTLGDDDKNINAAIEIRRQFDRIFDFSDEQLEKRTLSIYTDMPVINAVVYDDKKAQNLEKRLMNHKHPFNINFIGRLSEIYNYENIQKSEMYEQSAFRYHIEWVETEKRIRNSLSKQTPELVAQVCACYGADSIEDIEWYDGKFTDKNKKTQAYIEEIEKYHQFEYFRNSSVSKAIHKDMLKKFSNYFECKEKEDNFFCMCEACQRRRKTEHNRWMAYMRVNGYSYGEKRCDRAKKHPDLVETEMLDIVTQLKD